MEISARELLTKIKAEFREAGVTEYADAEWILCKVLGTKRSMLGAIRSVSEADYRKIMEMVELRKKRIPIDYIFGESEFFGLKLKVNENCLIPRIDTEVLAQEVLKEIQKISKSISVLDIGTGSGAIAIAIAKNANAELMAVEASENAQVTAVEASEKVKVTAVDVSEKALRLAEENAEANGVNVRFVKSDLFEKLADEKFDIIVSNPPYIESNVIDSLEIEVKDHEPRLALDGGADGLDFYRKIIAETPKYLSENGKIFFEIGYNQKESVKKLLEKDFENIICKKDYAGNDRVIFAKKRKEND